MQSVTTNRSGYYRTHVPAGKQHVYPMTGGQPGVDVTVKNGEAKRVDLTVPHVIKDPFNTKDEG